MFKKKADTLFKMIMTIRIKEKKMKKLVIITLSVVIGLVSLSNAVAADKSECIYGGRIDQLISFYQSRLYLTDSEYTILSDIGKDAEKMITYLQTQKDQLVREMKHLKIEFSSAKMNNYIVNKARI